MVSLPRDPDWRLVASFLAVAEAGSLSAAARARGISQPTLGRHIAALEAALGVELFDRRPGGVRPTPAGAALIAPAREMAAAAGRLALTAAGQAPGIAGTVRITASRIVSHYLLAPVLADLRRAHPALEVELVPSDRAENLLFREADIAIRMYRPEQLDVIARRLGTLEIGVFAAEGYLARAGHPETAEAALALDWVGYDRDELIVREMRRLGFAVDRSFFATRTDDQLAHVALIAAGAGLGPMPLAVAARLSGVVRVLDEITIPGLPVHLVAHERLRESPRMRAAADALAAGLAPHLA